MGAGLPNVAISDMQLHAPTRIARAFTHGRSMWEIPLDDLTDVTEHATTPSVFSLAQNYPNPFNPSTIISFDLMQPSPALLRVYDAAGRTVATLVDENLPAGKHSISWHGKNASGDPVSSGVYFYRLDVSGRGEMKKMALIR